MTIVKSTATILGLLIVISVIYYLTFWSFFGIDVFQYLQTGDIARGLIYPLRNSYVLLALIIMQSLVALLTFYWEEIGEKKVDRRIVVVRQKRKIKALIILVIITGFISVVLGAGHYVIITNKNLLNYAVSSGNFSITTIAVTITLAYSVINNKIILSKLIDDKNFKEKADSDWINSIDYLMVTVFAYLLFAAISYGIIDAKKIDTRMSFNLVTDNRILAPKSIVFGDSLIYLGSVSDKSIFLRPMNNNYFIIDKEQALILPIKHIYKNDKNLSIIDKMIKIIFAYRLLKIGYWVILSIVGLIMFTRVVSFGIVELPQAFRGAKAMVVDYMYYIKRIRKWLIKLLLYSPKRRG